MLSGVRVPRRRFGGLTLDSTVYGTIPSDDTMVLYREMCFLVPQSELYARVYMVDLAPCSRSQVDDELH